MLTTRLCPPDNKISWQKYPAERKRFIFKIRFLRSDINCDTKLTRHLGIKWVLQWNMIFWYDFGHSFLGYTNILGKPGVLRHWSCPCPPVASHSQSTDMMTSSNGNIFRVTSSLWGEPPVTGGFPSQRPVTWSFDIVHEQTVQQRIETPVI